MGYIRHHAIIVTSFKLDEIDPVHKKAKEIFGASVSDKVISQINVDYSFFIGPDGSKEGWEDSENGNDRRDQFVQYVESLKNEDGSSSVKYAELFYGDDDREAGIVRHN